MRNTILALFTLAILAPSPATSQEQNKVVFDSLKNQNIIEGYCTREFLEGFSPFNLHYADEYRAYTPQIAAPHITLDSMEGISVTLILATWCGDSREQVPRFFKVLDEIGYPSGAVTLVGVNGAKSAYGIDLTLMDITLVPTIIFFFKGLEIGRITETPLQSLEADLQEIISRKIE